MQRFMSLTLRKGFTTIMKHSGFNLLFRISSPVSRIVFLMTMVQSMSLLGAFGWSVNSYFKGVLLFLGYILVISMYLMLSTWSF